MHRAPEYPPCGVSIDTRRHYREQEAREPSERDVEFAQAAVCAEVDTFADWLYDKCIHYSYDPAHVERILPQDVHACSVAMLVALLMSARQSSCHALALQELRRRYLMDQATWVDQIAEGLVQP